jgi:hypothetical protein
MKTLSVPGLADRRPLAGGAVITWVAVSPWLWGFEGTNAAVANHVFMVLGFGPLILLIVALRPAAIITIVGGFWLALSPWVLGYAGEHLAWVNELVSGALMIALAARAAGVGWPTPSRRASSRLTPAGRATADQPVSRG